MRRLIAETLREDPKLAQAKQLLLDTVLQHQKAITGILPADPGRKQSYEETLAAYGKLRGGKLWYPYLGSGAGKGALVELMDGSIKYDFISGIGAHWAHAHQDIIAASFDAAASDLLMQGNLQQNQDSMELSQLLTKVSGFDHCFLTTSGAMACENGLKMLFQKKHPAHRILAFERCFMGRTLAMSQVTDKPNFRDGLPANVNVDYLPFFDSQRPKESIAAAEAALKNYIKRYPKQHAALCMELIQGEAGFNVGSREFFLPLIDIARENEIPILIDEVQTFGRTPSLFAFQYFGLEGLADIVTVGKISQVCATLFRDSCKPRPGLLSQTFTGSTSAIHASKVIVTSLTEHGYLGPKGKIAVLHNRFLLRLEAIASRHPSLIKGPYGIGTMIAFTPFMGDNDKVMKFSYALFEAGVIGFVAGSYPTRLRFLLPAGGITLKDIDVASKIIEQTLIEQTLVANA